MRGPKSSAGEEQRITNLFKQGGEMGKLILDHDWSTTSLGAISTWPQSLLTSLGIVLHSSFPMFLFWGKDLISFYNDAYRPSLGQEGKHPAIGKRGKEVWDFAHPIIQQVMTTGKPAWFENQLIPFFRNNTTEDVYWTFSHSAVFDEEGTINGVLVTCMETTQTVAQRKHIEVKVAERTAELEKAQHSLLEANRYLQEIINLFKEPLQVLEPIVENGKIIDFKFKLTNAAYAAYANATPDQLHGRRVGEVFPTYFETSSFTKPIETYQTGKSDTWEIHYAVDGLNLYNLMSATKLGGDVVLHFTDFTKLKLLQLQLLEKIDQLELSNKNLQEFGYAISHDLKEPLRKILVYINRFIDTTSITNDDLNALVKIKVSAERTTTLIDDLLSFSQLNDAEVKKEQVDLNQCLQQAMEALETVIEQKKAVITFPKLPFILGHRTQLVQMLQNLISNSLKYSKADVTCKIDIRTEHVSDNGKRYVAIEVIDNGIGFEQIYSERIFKIFSRLHNKNTYSGNGIGLSIVKKIVDNHQGIITVHSTPGAGSNFKVLLPVE